jgi:hypothetical protein
MKRILYTLLISVLFLNLTACSSDPSTTSADSTPRAVAAGADKVEPAAKMVIPVGTRIRVALLNAVSSDKSRAGDQFMASLSEPVIIDGKTILPKGTKLRGRVMDAVGSGRVKGRASLQLTLMQIVREEGNSISILTKPYTAVAEATKKRDAAVIGGGAGIGAAIGAIAGGGKGAAIGAAVGGGAGTGTVLATKGKEVRFGVEHPLAFTLADSVEL